jgi:hypothetical protein
MRLARRRCAAAALALVLAACVPVGERIYHLNIYRPDPQGYLFAAGTESRAVATHISGNPFVIAPATLANVVAASLQSAFPGRDVRFAVRRTSDVRSDVAMVVAFDPPTGTSAGRLCASPGRIPSAASGDTVTTMMAFCHGNQPMVSIEGRLDRRKGAGDAEFVLLLRDMARRMFETAPTRTP